MSVEPIKPNTSYRNHGQLLARYLRPQVGRVALMAGLLLLGIALQLASPQVIRYFLDTAESGGSTRALLNAALVFIAFALLQQALILASGYVSQLVSWAATNRLRTDLALHSLRLDMPFHKRHTPGEMIERIDGDVTLLANFFSAFVIQVIGNGLLVLGILALLFREDVMVGAGLAVYTLLTLLLLGRIQEIAAPHWKAERQVNADMFGYLEERIGGVEDVRAVGAEEYALNRLIRLMRVLLDKRRLAFAVNSLSYSLTGLLHVIGYAIGLALGVYLFTSGQATLGAAYLIVHYVSMLSEPIQHLREQLQDLQQATASIERIQGLFAEKPSVVSRPSSAVQDAENAARQPAPGRPLSVTFEDVSFHYEDNDNVLEGVSFHLPPGKVLGILGRTGSGKSTLTRLLFHLYDPGSGCIRLDGADLRDIPLGDLRGCVGLVTQDVQLFKASVRDNLTFFDDSIPDARLERILTDLGLWEWVQGLPLGLNTQLGSGGQGLSAGEAQLLAFARVFLKDPGLVVLDEASSRLDPATETRMERAIDRLFHQRTGVIIAHRLRTVQRADEILILEGGRAVEYGSRAQLAADPTSHFYSLLQTGLEEALA